MKYYPPSGHIYYENSDIPINKLEIHDSELLHEIEAELLLVAYEHFHNALNESTRFDEPYFREIHRYLFTKLYEWAGDYRTVNISKAQSMFCPYLHLDTFSEKLFSELKNENYLRNFEDPNLKEQFAERLGYYTCELIVLHPFNEGNGRALRLFIDMIVTYNGYEYIDYSSTLTDNGYISASIDCMEADCTQMTKIILNGLKKV